MMNTSVITDNPQILFDYQGDPNPRVGLNTAPG